MVQALFFRSEALEVMRRSIRMEPCCACQSCNTESVKAIERTKFTIRPALRRIPIVK